MSNRLTKGKGRVGSLSIDTSGGVGFAAGQATRKIMAIPFTLTSTAETDTTYDLPASGLVHDVWAKITTATSAGGQLSVGLLSSSSGGDADGFMAAVGSSSTGVIRGTWVSSTSGFSGTLITSYTRGAYFAAFSSGTTAATETAGTAAERAHIIDSKTARSITYTVNSSAVTPAGTIFIDYTEIT